MKKIYSLILLINASALSVFAQNDAMKQLEEQAKASNEPVMATFKSTKIINMQTNETNKKRNLDFRVTHLFGNTGKESGGGPHDLYGLDNSNDIRIALTYGITDRLMIGLSRCKRDENLVGELKYKILEQTTDNKMPLALSFYGQTSYAAKANTIGLYDKSIHRFNHCAQLIIARKFSSNFSFALVSSVVHRNIVEPNDENDLYSIGYGFRYKFTKSAAIIADYFYTLNRPDATKNDHYDVLGVGFEIETGGHVFTIMFTNASGILEDDFIPNTTDTWSKGGFKFAFNISRIFKL